jgi:hypothetical protein
MSGAIAPPMGHDWGPGPTGGPCVVRRVSTAGRRIAPGDPGRGGYRPLTWTRGEPHQTRRDSGAPPLPDGWRSRARPLLITAHLSDLHVTDHQSPARMELLDRYVDLDSPLRWELGVVGTYRPQELFTHHVVEAVVLAVNAELRGPVSGAPIDLAASPVTRPTTRSATSSSPTSTCSTAPPRSSRTPATTAGTTVSPGRMSTTPATGTRRAARTTWPAAATASPRCPVCWTRCASRSSRAVWPSRGWQSTATTTC